MNLLIRLIINALALWLATRLVDGISFDGEIAFLLVVAFIFGAVNTIVKPILMVLTFPFLIVTLGLVPARAQRRHALADRRNLRCRRAWIPRQQLQGRVHRWPRREHRQLRAVADGRR